MSYIKTKILKDNVEITENLSEINFLGSNQNIIDNGNGKISISSNPNALDDLTDVTISAVAAGESLVYDLNTSQWINVLTTVTTPGTGRILQVKFDRIDALSGTVSIPLTSSDPTITQGVELWTESIAPAHVSSHVRIGTSCTVSSSNNRTHLIFTFFRNNTCIGTGLLTTSARNAGHPFAITLYDSPNTTSDITYSCRVGKVSGNTWYINRLDDASILNGQLANQAYTVEEIGIN